ncbi:amylo-alpha-1,6-glucosidase [Catellatospora paridis]|uniref:amylo-alpha-1,6-glucosidase n=1 Tax=Catellatospora paridis TaxID=1617086 RepID=UPI0012D3E77D|nr:glycogen debranching N-terminal domain-containing protein [Catellatospora paridis]
MGSSDDAATARRPTPLDPYPRPRPAGADGAAKPYPPELGTDAIAVLEGRTFVLSDALGDVPTGSVGGLVHDDTRFLNRWELSLDGTRLSLLKSRAVDYYSAAFYLANTELPGLRANTVAVRRFRFVGNGMLEQVAAVNSGLDAARIELRLSCGTDFADLFEMKGTVRDRSQQITCRPGDGSRSLRFGYAVDGFNVACTVRVVRDTILDAASLKPVGETAVRVDGDSLVWDLDLAPGQLFAALVRVDLERDGVTLEPMHENFGEQQQISEGPLKRWLEHAPDIECDNADLNAVLDRSIVDLAALRIEGTIAGEPYVLPAAGLPWFMTLFGRDTLITCLQTLWAGPDLARGALHLLGELQGTRMDEFRDEEPGKILHEIRHGELTVLGEKPHSPYFGTADATPLWLILMSEYWRFTGDDAFVRERWPRVLAALEWIDRYGDRDGDGYVEYATRSSQGLGNQCWKDSWDGVQFHDGRIPYLPIATAEIQGYVYDAKTRAAELASQVIGDDDFAGRLTRQAEQLYTRFNRDFWSPDRGGFYVIGLDGDKQPIDSLTSNLGHLLWSGIVPPERASVIASHLMSDSMFSGWGVRTLSTSDRGFNPIGYHTGTIWPHDNSIIALGLARYGFRDEANRIALAQLEAATHSAFRLPEAFAGFPRVHAGFPVPYPTACSPQAWATGAPFAFAKVMLGLDAHDRQIRLDPWVPDEIGRIQISNLPAFGVHWDVEAHGATGYARLAR